MPRLKAHLHPETVGSDKLFLLTEDRHYLVQGAGAVAVAPLLDGRHDVADIAGQLAQELSLPQVLAALRKFERFGHLAEGRPPLDQATLAFWDALGIDPATAAPALAAARVRVVVLGAADAAPVTAALADAGVTAAHGSDGSDGDDGTDGTDGDDLTVVVTDDYLHPDLADLNARLLARGRPWLLARPHGVSLWLGPLFVPGDTGCWACLEQRLDGNRQVERYLQGKRGESQPFRTALAGMTSTARAAADLLATEAARVLAGDPSSPLRGRLLTLDSRILATERHELVRQPQCPACGDAGLLARRDPRVVLTPVPKRFTADGGHRTCPPEETYARLEKHVSPVLGAVTSLNLLTPVDNGITYSYSAGHNFAMGSDDLYTLRRNLRGQSGGKGRTDVQARVSGICEAVERFSGVWRGDEASVRGSFDELAGEAVHPESLLLFSEAQYRDRLAWNNDASRLHTVPERFRGDVPLDWTPAWSLTSDERRLVPAAYAWFGHPDLRQHFYCYSDANGNAGGNTLEEAVLQGFCELVERDSVGLWWYNRVQRPGIDLDAMRDPYVDTLREHYADLGRDLWLLDLTADLGIPAFAGVSHRVDHPVEDILLGFGAHLDPRMAALRALTELNQFLPAVSSRNPDGSTAYWEDDTETLRWWTTATLAAEPWLLPAPGASRKLSDLPALASDDIATDVATCVRQAASAGLEVVVLDQSRPEIELSVAKVMVPGMRHFWRRLAPGRLYDVPVSLGWLPEPTPEAGLNPTSVFF